MKPPSSARPTPNHEVVFAALRKTGRPLTAYELLDRLRPQGVSAPPTIYRALDRLINDGRAHRLESLNAFVACVHPHHGASAMFSICDDCGAAEEFADTSVNKRIAGWAKGTGFTLNRVILEIHGKCNGCASDRKPG